MFENSFSVFFFSCADGAFVFETGDLFLYDEAALTIDMITRHVCLSSDLRTEVPMPRTKMAEMRGG